MKATRSVLLKLPAAAMLACTLSACSGPKDEASRSAYPELLPMDQILTDEKPRLTDKSAGEMRVRVNWLKSRVNQLRVGG